jgi:hypothetical protein
VSMRSRTRDSDVDHGRHGPRCEERRAVKKPRRWRFWRK